MDDASLVITVTGTDRAGLLYEIAGVVNRFDAAIIDLRSLELRGQFAIMLLVQPAGDGASIDPLKQALAEFAGYAGLTVGCAPASAHEMPAVNVYRLTACGAERPGVLKQISHLMRVLGVNLEHIQTKIDPGRKLHVSMLLNVPRDVPISKVREFCAQLFSEVQMTWDLCAKAAHESLEAHKNAAHIAAERAIAGLPARGQTASAHGASPKA